MDNNLLIEQNSGLKRKSALKDCTSNISRYQKW